LRSRHTLTRRSLLRAGALASVATFTGTRPWALTPAMAAAGHLRRSSYDGLVGQHFRAGQAALQLLSVSDVAGAAVDPSLAGSEDTFVLTFSGPLEPALEAGTRMLSHPELGKFELFVSPVERPHADRRYEAVVDRSVGAPKSPPKPPAARDEQSSDAQPATPARTTAAPKGARLLRRVALRRSPRGARAAIVLRQGESFERVNGRLMRRGKTLAVATRAVDDRRAVLRFRGRDVRDLPAGTYTLQLTLIDEAGLLAIRRKRVKLS
jgi:hypothetical protein